MTTPTTTVPAEPTEAMIAALDRGLHEHWPNARAMALGAWKLMIAAAPVPPPSGKEVRQEDLDALRRSIAIEYYAGSDDQAHSLERILALLTPALSDHLVDANDMVVAPSEGVEP